MKGLRQKRTLLVMMIAYVAVFLLPLSVGIIQYFLMEKSLKDELVADRAGEIQRLGDTIEQEVLNLLETANAFSRDEKLLKYLSIEGEMQPSDHILSREVIDSLSVSLSYYHFMDSFYIYARNTDMILTNKALYSAELFFRYGFERGDISYEQWKMELDTMGPAFLSARRASVRNGTNVRERLLIEQTLPKDNLTDPQAVFTAVIDSGKMLDILCGQHAGTSGAILDANNCVLAESSGEAWEIPVNSEQNSDIEVSEGNQSLTITYQLPSLRWYIVCRVLKDTFLQDIAATQRTMVIIYVVLLISGVLLIFLLARRQYRPVSDIVDSLLQQGLSYSSADEYEFILSSVNAVLEDRRLLEKSMVRQTEEYKAYQQAVSSSAKHIQSGILAGVISRTIPVNDEMLECMRLYDLSFPYERILVLVLIAADAEAMEYSNADIRLAVIGKMKESWETESIRWYFADTDDQTLAVILNCDENEDEDRIILETEELAQAMQLTFGLNYGCSSMYLGLNQISAAYQEALENSEREENEIAKKTFYELYKERFFRAITAMDMDRCRELSSGCCQIPDRTLDAVICVIHAGILALEQEQLSLKDADIDEEMIAGMLHSSSSSTAERSVYDICSKIVSALKQRSSSIDERTNMVMLARQFIDKHLEEVNLNQTMVAQELGISPSSLSKQFKNVWKMNMLDYINQARVIRSQQYLAESDQTLIQIAEAVGFASQHTFIRVFKKYEGITPGQYRALQKRK